MISIKKSDKGLRWLNHWLAQQYCSYSTLISDEEFPSLLFLESWENDSLHNIFVIRIIDRCRAVCLNSFYLTIDQEEQKFIMEYLKSNYWIKALHYTKILPNQENVSSIPILRRSDLCDNIAQLPPTFQDYLSSLGKQTRKHSKYYLGRITRDFPSIEYIFQTGKDIDYKLFKRIVEYSKLRMASKNIKYGGDASDQKIYDKLQIENCGFLTGINIDGQLIAGCVGFIIGPNLYLSKIAHDPAFNNYNAGQVSLLKLIEWAIDNHAVTNFHFLWGKNVDYKERFGGKPYSLFNYTIYSGKSNIYYRDAFSNIILKAKNYTKDIFRRNKKLIQLYHKLTYKQS